MNPIELLVSITSSLLLIIIFIMLLKQLIIIKNNFSNTIDCLNIINIHSAGLRTKSIFNATYDLVTNKSVIINNHSIMINNNSITYYGLREFNGYCSELLISNEVIKCLRN